IWSAMVEPGPMVKARVGRELGPQLPESVPSLRMRQNPPVTVTALGLSMVTVGCGDEALVPTAVAIVIIITKATRCSTRFAFAIVNRIVTRPQVGFNRGLFPLVLQLGKIHHGDAEEDRVIGSSDHRVIGTSETANQRITDDESTSFSWTMNRSHDEPI